MNLIHKGEFPLPYQSKTILDRVQLEKIGVNYYYIKGCAHLVEY